jgi:plasmid stabilization system protein ParE
MKFRFLASAKRDLIWFRNYYQTVFPEGSAKAREHYRLAKRVLLENPQAGRPASAAGVRELSIARTPFCFVYRVMAGTIEVIHVWDLRGDRPDVWSDD